ncbi:MAG: HD domain-containing protein [Candidatus Colwellbacteria bacterium]|nr:HD domain-containing protein [Candidatus Colwellbacteria bacterium]
MNREFRKKLLNIAESKISRLNDPSHDIGHTSRVLALAEKIGIKEKADLDIVRASAIFHDVIVYPKNHHKRLSSSRDSADFARKVLIKCKSFPREKIEPVYKSIESCSYTKGVKPDFLEAQILQDADSLEAMGAIAIMRTFSSAGQMNKSFYNNIDPFCKKRSPDDTKYALDLFLTRLLIVHNRLHTRTAKMLAKGRLQFLHKFLKQLEIELSQCI